MAVEKKHALDARTAAIPGDLSPLAITITIDRISTITNTRTSSPQFSGAVLNNSMVGVTSRESTANDQEFDLAPSTSITSDGVHRHRRWCCRKSVMDEDHRVLYNSDGRRRDRRLHTDTRGADRGYHSISVSIDVGNTTLHIIDKKAAAVTGDSARAVENSFELSAEGNRIHVTAGGRTPSAAADSANVAATALANQYQDIGSSFSGITVSAALVEPAA